MLETSGDKKNQNKKKNDIDNKYEELTYKTTMLGIILILTKASMH